MMNLYSYEDVIELDIPVDLSSLNLESLNWVQYNPRKPISRYGCSITSLDGTDTGVPDLDSVLEFNQLNNTTYSEKDFNVPTKHSKPFEYLLSNFNIGRSHYLKLPAGGFFPWHRDGDKWTIRLIYTIENCNSHNLIWLEDEKLLHLENHKWYYINTHKKHCVFSFNNSVFAVFNALVSEKNLNQLLKHAIIK